MKTQNAPVESKARPRPIVSPEPLAHLDVDSPIGTLRLVARDGFLVGLLFDKERGVRSQTSIDAAEASADPGAVAVVREAARQLAEYFAGQRRDFDLPLDPSGTAFQKSVWEELLRIPYGLTTNYGSMAKAIGSPKAARAVGAANGRNPIAIIVPCHRAVGADGSLTGFGGGLPVKQYLLELEGRGRN